MLSSSGLRPASGFSVLALARDRIDGTAILLCRDL
jgi:hypothetical protein